jgi:hypothetical protein
MNGPEHPVRLRADVFENVYLSTARPRHFLDIVPQSPKRRPKAFARCNLCPAFDPPISEFNPTFRGEAGRGGSAYFIKRADNKVAGAVMKCVLSSGRVLL